MSKNLRVPLAALIRLFLFLKYICKVDNNLVLLQYILYEIKKNCKAHLLKPIIIGLV